MDIVIGLIGAKRAGKTTAFNAIKSVLDVQEITLASKLKDVCAQVFEVPRDYFDDQKLKEVELRDYIFLTHSGVRDVFALYGLNPDFDKFIRPHIGKVLISPRQIAQYVGTEVLRNYAPDIHCDWAARAITAKVGVVTDMRFPNEYAYFDKNYPKFYPAYIQNYGAENEASKDTHASEAHLRDLAKLAVVTLSNNGPIKVFEDSVRLFVGSLHVYNRT